MSTASTIVAPATARGRAALGILRVSGPGAGEVCARVTGAPPGAPRTALLRSFRDPRSGETIDRGLAVWFAAPRSYTGEDLLELQHHGGLAVTAAMLDAVRAVPGVRLAEPGEFTRRALRAGRLDLTQVEAVADLVDATTRAQARQAIRQLDGALGRACRSWQEGLLAALALAEAEIDFGADQDVPEQGAAITALIGPILVELRRTLADGGAGERLREGATIAVVGPPNSGKSSLVNRLASRDVAIVTPIPGTTRDVLEVQLELRGLPLVLLDTAGLREATDPIEREGIARARRRAAMADLRLIVVDSPAAAALHCTEPDGRDSIVVLNKVDLQRPPDAWAGAAISCVTGEGLEALLDVLASRVASRLSDGAALVTHHRHRQQLESAAGLLERLIGTAALDAAMIAEELRLALHAFDGLTGRVTADDVLGRIFARFCIGK